MRRTDAVHDASLAAWTVLAALRAAGRGLSGSVVTFVVAVNLISGTPSAWRRAREGHRDAVTLAAPVAVACAVVTTARPRPRWAPVAATVALVVLRVAERSAAGRHPPTR